MLAADLGAEVTALAGRLTAAGLPATTDARNINPPAAWVTLGTATFDTLGGDVTAVAEVYLIAPDNGQPTALNTLAGLLEHLASVVIPSGEVTPANVPIPGSPAPLPALRLTVPIGD